jgi:hypothetical protein
MSRDFFDQTPEKQAVLIEREVIRNAEGFIYSCEHCNPQGADLPFVEILDVMTGSDPKITDYILEAPAKCPNCRVRFSKRRLLNLQNDEPPKEIFLTLEPSKLPSTPTR